jgi:hypothetical protein
VSLLLTGALVATGVLLGRFLARGGRKDASKLPAPKAAVSDAPPPPEPKPAPRPKAAKLDFEAFPCKLGDVVMRAGGDEAWLAGGLVFSEELPVAVLFIAPDAGGDRALYVKPSPSPSIAWLAPLDKDALQLSGEPPSALEVASDRFDRVRRLPLRVVRIGSGAPDVGDSAIVAEYACSSGAVLVVVASHGAAKAWRGTVLESGTYDVLPGGDEA